MAYSNRPGYRPDPTTSPYMHDARTGELQLKPPFQPSKRLEERQEAQAMARWRNRLPKVYQTGGL